MADELTQEKWKAIFEVGGIDALWEAMCKRSESDNAASFHNGYAQAHKEVSERYRKHSNFMDGVKAWSFSILGVALLIFAFYCVARTSIRDGKKELAACMVGNTSVCQQDAMDCKQLFGRHAQHARLKIYMGAYKKATGHDLPNMEMSYEDD